MSGGGFVNFTTSVSSGTVISADSFPSLRRIIYKDANWGYTSGYWRSRESASGESATGRLDIGYLKLRNTLHLAMAGGGSTNGNSKTFKIIKSSDNTVLATHTLGTLIGVNTDQLVAATINTTAIADNTVYLRFEDNDSGSGWAWIGVDPVSAVVSD